ncbi:glycoside hydrolase family 16 protein [Sphaerobolus stellatus SS14]|uniref:Glycoside hydrolase family 16 protein n=1 Tax=Sphaerobolus stellatus (strain SS14) TaxID=990650 RepID=A0A0C9VDG3_SPHS4|nr:glycoside hydrolase family 16 protein [Sphaerobolus stellatus SS14]
MSDLRTSWNGLLGYSAATLLQARDADNFPSSGSGGARCIITTNLVGPKAAAGQPGSAGPGSNSGSSANPGSSTQTGKPSAPSSVPAANLPPSPWNLVKTHAGDSFFDEWDFWTDADPTHGNVQFVDENTARSTGLISVNANGTVMMKVDTTPVITSPNRQSVRITTNYQYTGGILVLDAVHAPTGCATWPAFWSNGPNWPNNGEIDIMEGVNDLTVNQASIHTAPGCMISNSEAANGATGTLVGGSNCASAESNNGGCGQQATSLSNTYGPPFNSNGGGVYAMVWDDTGISVFFFPRNNIPVDITGLKPQPQNWGVPFARWPTTNCTTSQFFNVHSAIFDTTLCGDWAGNVWNTAQSPGQEQSCAQRTGFQTCAQFVQNSGASFDQAYWEVNSVRLYQMSN